MGSLYGEDDEPFAAPRGDLGDRLLDDGAGTDGQMDWNQSGFASSQQQNAAVESSRTHSGSGSTRPGDRQGEISAQSGAQRTGENLAARQQTVTLSRRNVRLVKALEVLVFLCWVLTFGSGAYGFWLGFDTKSVAKESDADICILTTGEPEEPKCALTKDHRKICEACHRESFDASLIVISFYMAFFGGLNILSYCTNVYNKFGFLRSRMGRGFMLFFLGNLATAQGVNFLYTESITLSIGITNSVIGLLLMLSYCLVSSGHMTPPQTATAPPQNMA